MSISKRKIQGSIRSIIKRAKTPEILKEVNLAGLANLEELILQFDVEQAFEDTVILDEQFPDKGYTLSLINTLKKKEAAKMVIKYSLLSKDLKGFKDVANTFYESSEAYHREWHLWRM